MAYTTVDDPGIYFKTITYTGNATDDRTVTGVGFQPDWLWIKNRTDTEQHRLQDAVRGATKNIKSSGNGVEETTSNTVKSFDSDGFTLGVDNAINGNSDSMVSWNWKANGQGSSNTSGTINSTYTSANTTAGFSIVSYTGTGSAGTIGHGLGVKPQVIIVKNLEATENWMVYHEKLDASAPEDYYILLNSNAVRVNNATTWNDTAPTTTLFTVGTHDATNKSGDKHIAYCFTDIKGYSKFGSYTGNGNADGPMTNVGFRPAWVMIKANDAEGWIIHDNKRNGFNPDNDFLYANTSGSEVSSTHLDILSNGFKARSTNGVVNGNGSSYYYFAFAEAPFTNSSGAIANAR